ncbi:hypothetical protein R83H12_01020 [Fibrobacteria bacterium R8-3-H12]
MSKSSIIIYTLLPIMFMLHDFEEIIFFKYWLNKNKDYLQNKFPKIGPKIYSHCSKFTAAGFALAIAEEFIIISLLTYISIIMQNFYIWFTVFMGFSIHIIIHILQFIVYRKYIPTIITSILVLPYCIYGFIFYLNNEAYKIEWIIICSIIGIIGVMINLKFIHYLGEKFSNWEIKATMAARS